ncbi:unnamed protein product [Urochloa humidicola]
MRGGGLSAAGQCGGDPPRSRPAKSTIFFGFGCTQFGFPMDTEASSRCPVPGSTDDPGNDSAVGLDAVNFTMYIAPLRIESGCEFGRIKGFRVCHNAPCLSHLLFDDNSSSSKLRGCTAATMKD